MRLTLSLADKLAAAGKDADVLALYDKFLKETPDYPDALALYKKLQALATQLNRRDLSEKYAREIYDRSPDK